MSESTQHKIDRVRPPRVQITYDVEVGNAIEMKELPFVVGVLADLSGMPEKELPKIKERKFVEIDRDNFQEIMAAIEPRLELHVKNKLLNDDSETKVELKFSNMEDFKPLNITKQVPELRKLYEARCLLKDLITKMDGNDVLEGLLQDVISNTSKRDALIKELEDAKQKPSA